MDGHVLQAQALQLLGQHIEHAGRGPAAHAHVHAVPVAIATGQRAPLAAIGCHVQDGVDYFEVLQPHVAALARQQRDNLLELFTGELHPAIFAQTAAQQN